METNNAKPPKYPYRKSLAFDIAIYDAKPVQSQSQQSNLKNVKRGPV